VTGNDEIRRLNVTMHNSERRMKTADRMSECPDQANDFGRIWRSSPPGSQVQQIVRKTDSFNPGQNESEFIVEAVPFDHPRVCVILEPASHIQELASALAVSPELDQEEISARAGIRVKRSITFAERTANLLKKVIHSATDILSTKIRKHLSVNPNRLPAGTVRGWFSH
jgi:hypothetical protein